MKGIRRVHEGLRISGIKASQRYSSSSCRSVIDLRSDTVTLPSKQMRERMATCAVGDDVYGDDPTVLELEAAGARLMGKAASVFVPSGTMANLLALGVHCRRGEEVICGNRSHIYHYEAGGASVLMGIPFNVVTTQVDGTLDLADVAAAVRADDSHCAPSRVLSLEQTHNLCGGRVLSVDYITRASVLCQHYGLKLHVDGARLLNASVALGVTPQAMCQHVDTLTLCLSKGLGAPVGSLLIGSDEYIYKARRLRKMLGGGMRQVGVLATCGLVALEQNVDRLAEDHANAKYFAEQLSDMPHVQVDQATLPPETNMVLFSLPGQPQAQVVKQLRAMNVLLGGMGPVNIRAVMHMDVSRSQVSQAIAAVLALK